MAKKAKQKSPRTKADLMSEIELKIQELNLLASALKADRSRKPETLEEYEQRYLDLLQNRL